MTCPSHSWLEMVEPGYTPSAVAQAPPSHPCSTGRLQLRALGECGQLPGPLFTLLPWMPHSIYLMTPTSPFILFLFNREFAFAEAPEVNFSFLLCCLRLMVMLEGQCCWLDLALRLERKAGLLPHSCALMGEHAQCPALR